ncbi:hypothetical protein H7T43_04245 [Peribacillus simplex]|uniref:glycosyl hydrolase family 28-related protein n=1 Tax=Peribacillus simplex TaxID=1478 RepID=UPI002989EE66|nr:glycosyl hydrolase family 28-related protein [Peribacillus simplex]MBX9954123.1 hypothetical protein [Peribacillus simplex]
MIRRNFLRNLLLFIFALFFGYTIKKYGENLILEKGNSINVKGNDGKSIAEKIKVLMEGMEETTAEMGSVKDLGENPRSLSRSLSERGYNVKDFGAKGDGKTDDTIAIQRAIDFVKILGGGKILLAGKDFLITSSLVIPTGVHLIGLGMACTSIKTMTNDFDAITIEQNARQVTLRDFDIVSNKGVGEANCAIRAHENNGGAEHRYLNINIWNFKYGTRVGAVWWNNTVENIRWNNCDYSFYGDGGTGGQCINNLFLRCYSNEPLTNGYYIISFKNTTWYSCNNGGTSTKSSSYMHLINSKGMKLIGCNFENILLAQDDGGIVVWSDSLVSLDGCSFVNNKGVNGAISYELVSRDEAIVKVDNCFSIQKGFGMKDFCSINDSKIIYENSPNMTLVTNLSSIPMVNMDSIINQTRQYTPKALGVDTIDRLTFINPGTGVFSERIQITLIGVENIVASAYDLQANGMFKVEFINISDGVRNTSPHKVAWVVW